MIRSFRSLSLAAFASVLILTLTSKLSAQGSGAQIPGPWPMSWTGCGCSPLSYDALQILYDPWSALCAIPDAALRLTIGTTCNTPIFGQLGVVDSLHDPFLLPRPAEWFSAFAPISATVLRSSEGDLVLSATTFNATPTHGPTPPLTASIRFGTTPSDTLSDTADHPADIERMVITGNGNVGIDIPPMANGLDSAVDQVQIGGGSVPPPAPWYTGYTTPIPGLTIYGGNRFEGMMRPDTALPFPVDWRGIAFNHYEDHMTGIGSRVAPMAWSGIGFSDNNGGLVNIGCTPWHTGDALTEDSGGMTLQLQGNSGLYLWSDDRLIGGSQFKHLFEVWRKGYDGGLGIRNDSGLFFHHTPVYIGGATDVDFTNLANVHPRLGDDSTWMLAVNGSALFKEAYVSIRWPDFIFDPGYHLMPIEEVEKYIEMNHHLPDVPSASEMSKTGVPLGATEAKLMQKIEELTKYAIQQDKEIQELKTEIQEIRKQEGK